MTVQEALKLLNDTEFAEKHQGKEEYTEMLLMCKEALEKQIPKKPYKTKEPISQKQNDYYCSVCKRYLGDDMKLKHACLQPEYCQHCGQALDWSDTK